MLTLLYLSLHPQSLTFDLPKPRLPLLFLSPLGLLRFELLGLLLESAKLLALISLLLPL